MVCVRAVVLGGTSIGSGREREEPAAKQRKTQRERERQMRKESGVGNEERNYVIATILYASHFHIFL